MVLCFFFYFFFQAEDGIRDGRVTGVQTCALRIFLNFVRNGTRTDTSPLGAWYAVAAGIEATESLRNGSTPRMVPPLEIGRASCRERVEISGVDGAVKEKKSREEERGIERRNSMRG